MLLVRRPYRFARIKAPAAMATMAMSAPRPEKLRWSRPTSPYRMSQTPSNSIPRFLVSFVEIVT